ncbi:MAG: DedA family protein [Candidatus Woesearchaeota archaeon]|nr:DedA family protein [Candidatus Woesearchaeota archaeon]
MVKFGGLPFLFLLVILEGNPLVGSFIPGQLLVIFVGFLISTSGIFGLKSTVIVVFFGALLGDLIGYFMGKKLGVIGLTKFGFSPETKIYKASKDFFEKYGAWSIFFGREFNLTRAFMPFFAGSFGMKFIEFLLISIFSCIVWSVLSVLLGYYFGYFLVSNFKFFMLFLFFFVVYLGLVYFVYRGLSSFYVENKSYLRRHAIHTFFSLGFLVSMLVLMIFIIRWDYYILFNDSFSFLYFNGFYIFGGFFTSSIFLVIYFFIIFFIFMWKKRFRMLVVYVWSVIFMFFYTIVLSLSLKLFIGILPYFTIMLFTLFVFYTWVIFELFFRESRFFYLLNILLSLILILVFLSKFSFSGNLYLTLFSFLLGVIASDLIWLLSYYQILDNCLYNCRDSECNSL